MARVRNRDKLLRKLAALPQKARQTIGPAIDQGAAEIVGMQKRLVPKESGALERSIRAVKGNYKAENANVRGVSAGGVQGDPDLSVTIVAGDAAAWYARLVEFGTAPHENKGLFAGTQHPGTRPQPYFYPPVRALRKRVKSRITRATKKAAREVASS
ncbi:HK97-gp10 family putative phage morphogenesis protein [Microvirga lenta]|uniref:HK97-gp10 family putative phage morphogenesis protein n=1 Tax=Microvirga lenta TaxID=2881337 RepID=UPI001CFE8BFD|nr:HK97-gp10 family putative phage morphogenesis protein [Microvirga lenta]MCB5173646.1 HK97 gp10 family phage protein [Microvirga lenta]